MFMRTIKITVKNGLIFCSFLFTFSLMLDAASAGGFEAQKSILSEEFSDDRIKSCLIENVDPLQCSRTLVNFCASHPAAQSEELYGHCVEIQHTFWDGQLNKAYHERMEYAARHDKAQGTPEGQSALSLKAALRKTQRAWLAFQKAACEYERVQAGPNLGGAVRYMECMSEGTLRRFMELR